MRQPRREGRAIIKDVPVCVWRSLYGCQRRHRGESKGKQGCTHSGWPSVSLSCVLNASISSQKASTFSSWCGHGGKRQRKGGEYGRWRLDAAESLSAEPGDRVTRLLGEAVVLAFRHVQHARYGRSHGRERRGQCQRRGAPDLRHWQAFWGVATRATSNLCTAKTPTTASSAAESSDDVTAGKRVPLEDPSLPGVGEQVRFRSSMADIKKAGKARGSGMRGVGGALRRWWAPRRVDQLLRAASRPDASLSALLPGCAGEVVQHGQGVWLHHARRRERGHLRAPDSHPDHRLPLPARGERRTTHPSSWLRLAPP